MVDRITMRRVSTRGLAGTDLIGTDLTWAWDITAARITTTTGLGMLESIAGLKRA
jgi:hypothetical protein